MRCIHVLYCKQIFNAKYLLQKPFLAWQKSIPESLKDLFGDLLLRQSVLYIGMISNLLWSFVSRKEKNDSYLIHIVINIIKCLEWKYQFFKHVVMSKWVWSVFVNIFLFLALRRILKNTEFSSDHHVSVSELNKLINYCNQDQR